MPLLTVTPLARLPFTTNPPPLTVVPPVKGIGAGEGQDAIADLGETAASRDDARKDSAGVVVAGGERGRAERDGARACERADRLVEACEVKDGAARNRKSAGRREGVDRASL